MKLTRITVMLFLFLVTQNVFAQFDSILNDYKKQFDVFTTDIEEKHHHFVNSNDSVFASYLKDSWEKFNVFFEPDRVTPPKPIEQPTLESVDYNSLEHPIEIIPSKTIILKQTENPKIELKKEEQPIKESSGENLLNIDYYGTTNKLPATKSLPTVQKISESEISRYYLAISKEFPLENLLFQLNQLKRELKLNDWGYLKLLEAVSQKLSVNQTDQKLLLWIMLMNSGYNAKVGYSENAVYLLVPTIEKVYSSWFINIENQTYYLLNNKSESSTIPPISVHRADYPKAKPLVLKLETIPTLKENLLTKEFVFKGKRIKISSCQNLMRFFKDYPKAEMGVYFAAPISERHITSLRQFFHLEFERKSLQQKIEVLLNFVQTAFPYKTDQEQFGKERVFFPDEIFYYPFSDCEDRAVIFCQLVKKLTGIECIGLDFPGHVNTAVALPDTIKGNYITYNNMKYYVCDPTYTNAPIGLLPEEFNGIKPKIISFE
jgi:hypothetical protein